MTGDHNGNDSGATLVKQSPSVVGYSSNRTSSPIGSIFDTPKMHVRQKKKRYADRAIIDDDMDIDAERMTRSMTKALRRTVHFADEPQRINQRRTTFAI